MYFNGPKTQSAKSVTTTRTQVTTLTDASFVAFTITPTDGTIYYGDSTVTASTGQPLAPNQTLTITTRNPEQWYLISAGTVNVRVLLHVGTR